MKVLLIVCLALCGLVNNSQCAVETPIAINTKTQGCVESGLCGSLCSYDGAKLFPHDNLNQPGKCRVLKCTKDFSITVTSSCANDPEFKWTKPDKTKLYPECCGTKTFY